MRDIKKYYTKESLIQRVKELKTRFKTNGGIAGSALFMDIMFLENKLDEWNAEDSEEPGTSRQGELAIRF